jgi:hypothetical protein
LQQRGEFCGVAEAMDGGVAILELAGNGGCGWRGGGGWRRRRRWLRPRVGEGGLVPWRGAAFWGGLRIARV